MKKPKSTGSGTTGAWKLFAESFNKVGDDEATKRRRKLEGKSKKLFNLGKKKK